MSEPIKKGIDRRTFLKLAGLTGAGITLYDYDRTSELFLYFADRFKAAGVSFNDFVSLVMGPGFDNPPQPPPEDWHKVDALYRDGFADTFGFYGLFHMYETLVQGRWEPKGELGSGGLIPSLRNMRQL